jgi:hypothetical protein
LENIKYFRRFGGKIGEYEIFLTIRMKI